MKIHQRDVFSNSAAVLSCSAVSDSFATPWTVARQAPLSMGILQARILEWVAISSSRGSSRPRAQTRVSITGRQILYCLSHQGSQRILEWVAYPFSRGTSPSRNQTVLLHCKLIIYLLSHQGSQRILEWVAYPFSSRFS